MHICLNLKLYIYMYIYICTCIYFTHIFLFTHPSHMHTYYIHRCSSTFMFTYVAYRYVSMYAHIRIFARACTHTHTFATSFFEQRLGYAVRPKVQTLGFASIRKEDFWMWP